MKKPSEMKYADRFRKFRTLYDLVESQYKHFRGMKHKKWVDLIIKDCRSVIVRSIQILERFANQTDIPLQAVITAVMRAGSLRFFYFVNPEKHKEFELWAGEVPREEMRNPTFCGLKIRNGKTLSIKFEKQLILSCKRIAKSLALADVGIIYPLVLIAGLYGYDQLPQRDQRALLRIIRDFDYWLDQRLMELRKRYKMDYDQLWQKHHQQYVKTYELPPSLRSNNQSSSTEIQR